MAQISPQSLEAVQRDIKALAPALENGSLNRRASISVTSDSQITVFVPKEGFLGFVEQIIEAIRRWFQGGSNMSLSTKLKTLCDNESYISLALTANDEQFQQLIRVKEVTQRHLQQAPQSHEEPLTTLIRELEKLEICRNRLTMFLGQTEHPLVQKFGGKEGFLQLDPSVQIAIARRISIFTSKFGNESALLNFALVDGIQDVDFKSKESAELIFPRENIDATLATTQDRFRKIQTVVALTLSLPESRLKTDLKQLIESCPSDLISTDNLVFLGEVLQTLHSDKQKSYILSRILAQDVYGIKLSDQIHPNSVHNYKDAFSRDEVLVAHLRSMNATELLSAVENVRNDFSPQVQENLSKLAERISLLQTFKSESPLHTQIIAPFFLSYGIKGIATFTKGSIHNEFLTSRDPAARKTIVFALLKQEAPLALAKAKMLLAQKSSEVLPPIAKRLEEFNLSRKGSICDDTCASSIPSLIKMLSAFKQAETILQAELQLSSSMKESSPKRKEQQLTERFEGFKQTLIKDGFLRTELVFSKNTFDGHVQATKGLFAAQYKKCFSDASPDSLDTYLKSDQFHAFVELYVAQFAYEEALKSPHYIQLFREKKTAYITATRTLPSYDIMINLLHQVVTEELKQTIPAHVITLLRSRANEEKCLAQLEVLREFATVQTAPVASTPVASPLSQRALKLLKLIGEDVSKQARKKIGAGMSDPTPADLLKKLFKSKLAEIGESTGISSDQLEQYLNSKEITDLAATLTA